MSSTILIVDDEYSGRETLESILEGEGYNLVMLIVAITTGSALFFSYRRTPIYSSTAEVQVTPLSASQILTTNP